MAGDAAHQLSPFGGGRGGNSGVQDADNLGWKLASVINGLASPALLETYGEERQAAADENMLISRRSSRFIVPDTPAATALRNSVLQACGRVKGVEAYLNTGRLSTANRLPEGTFVRPVSRSGQTASRVGMVLTDAPITGFGASQWLSEIIGEAFCLLVACDKDSTTADASRAAEELRRLRTCPVTLVCIGSAVNQGAPCRDTLTVQDPTGLLRERYGLRDGVWYIVRPDSYVVGYGERLDVQAICDAVDVTTNGAYIKPNSTTEYGT